MLRTMNDDHGILRIDSAAYAGLSHAFFASVDEAGEYV